MNICLLAASVPTPSVLSAGFNPVWYDTLRFTIHTPELAMVRFVVEDYDKTSKNDFVGQFTLPLSCMQQGKAEDKDLKRQLTAKSNKHIIHIISTHLDCRDISCRDI